MTDRQVAGWGCAIVCVCLLVIGGCGVVSLLGYGVKKANEQFGVDASLAKYEEFKDMSAKLDAKLATIESAEKRVASLEEQYKGVARKDWARSDLEQSNIWRAEVSGMRASYNDLASEYNSRMAKFNFAYANVGDLPKGADKPLPREYKPYETK